MLCPVNYLLLKSSQIAISICINGFRSDACVCDK
jgi:hypothetical protein